MGAGDSGLPTPSSQEEKEKARSKRHKAEGNRQKAAKAEGIRQKGEATGRQKEAKACPGS